MIGRGHMDNKRLRVTHRGLMKTLVFFMMLCFIKCFDYLEFILTIHMIIDNNNVLYQARRLVRGVLGEVSKLSNVIIIKPSREDTKKKIVRGIF